VRRWPLWELPRWLVGFIALVTAADAAAIAVAAVHAPVSWHDVLVCGALMICTAATVELTKRAGENAGLISDVYAVWELPIAILLPVAYALVVPVLRFSLTQWRIRRIPTHRRVFSAAVVSLSYAAASTAFHGLTGSSGELGVLHGHTAVWVLALAVAAIVQWIVNTTLLYPAIKSSDPALRVRDLYLARESVHNDVTELCVAVLVTLGIAVTPITIVFAFPFVTLLQRSFRHAQLVNASRIDSKTGLLNAGTWEREAASEVARAIRTRSPLSVALMDIDHFKGVNDAHGHLVGDAALKAISDTLVAFLRDYDLIGRFGGEEFAFLLPQTSPVDAYRIAERIRAYIGAMPIDTGDALGSGPVNVTVSIGVASLGSLWDTGGASHLTDLLAAADAALYRAKRDGRDRVCVITEKATFSGSPQTPAGSLPEALVPSEPGAAARGPAGSHS
jgi:diguanylate cyclase (GGDEF)-like protein